jgi:hypothetical protein
MNYLSGKLTSILVSVTLLSLVALVRAEDIYIAQAAQGSDTGAAAANAHSAAWFNAAGNWGTGAGKISAGDTVHLVGTISTALTVQASGASGSVITILFESGAKLSAAHWTTSGALNINSKSFLVIDGGTNGLIECTDNGTTKTYQVDTNGILGAGLDHVTIQNLTITNMYDRTAFSTTDGHRMGIPINIAGSYLTVQNCTLSGGDTMIAISYTTGSQSNWTVTGNTISNCNHGITMGCAQVNAFVTDVTISNNLIDHLDCWGPISGNHLDGIIIFNEASDSSGSITNLYVYGNTIGPNVGTINTAAVFLDTAGPQLVNARVYNNLFTYVSPYGWANGCVVGGATGLLIANNTFIGYRTRGSGSATGLGSKPGGTNIIHENNLYYSVGCVVNFGGSSSFPAVFVSEYNIYYDLPGGTGAFYFPNYAAGNWSLWQGAGYDATGHSTRSQPTLDANYVPTSADTVAKGKGTNLSAYFTTDKNGNPRPATGAWDIGAFISGAPLSAVAPSTARTTITVR